MKRAGLLLIAAASACSDSTETIGECVGQLQVTVPLATVPTKVRVEWRYGDRADLEVLDECTEDLSRLILERRTGALIVNDGSFGYTPPETFDLAVFDLGDCTATGARVVQLTQVSTGGAWQLCDDVELTVP